ncbi:MAG TPA: hypothetical protein PK636_02825 [bacterium]|mgnify:CR=1 FL=1|nr:hypothetical protein [bacterium]HPJ71599.1 hypothetical protein [bacterium]HPQ66011.1 hypothetical protein [bacterium]
MSCSDRKKPNKRRHWVLKTVLGLAAAALGARLLLFFYGAEIVSWTATRFLGLDTRVERLRISFSGGRLEAARARMAQPRGFGEGPMFAFERLELGFSPGSLLRGRPAVTTCTLIGPTAAMVTDAAGRLNFSEAFPSEDDPASDSDADDGGDAGRFRMSVGALDLRGGSFTHRILPPAQGSARAAAPMPAGAVKTVDLHVSGARIDTAFEVPVFVDRGSLALSGGTLSQPADFGTGPLFTFQRLEAEFGPFSFADGIEIERLAVGQPSALLIMSRSGIFNISAAFASETGDGGGDGGEGGPAPAGPPPMEIRRLTVSGGKFAYRDYLSARPGEKTRNDAPFLALEGSDIEIVASAVRLRPSPGAPALPPAELELRAGIRQGQLPKALLGIMLKAGPIDGEIPLISGVLRIVSLELDTLGDRVPAGTRKALGGDVVDAGVDLGLTPHRLDCLVTVEADGSGAPPLTLRIEGSPRHPSVDTSSVLFGILTRTGGAVGNVFLGVGKAGYQIGATTINTVGTVGAGAFNMIYSLGKGLGTTVVGAATADGEKIAAGLTEATVGTASEAFHAVADAGGELVSGTFNAAEAATDAESAQRWRAARDTRWEQVWKDAARTLAKISYPPLSFRDETVLPGRADTADSSGAGDGALPTPTPVSRPSGGQSAP